MKVMKKIEYILLGTTLLLGLFVRLYKIQNPIADWHSWRQTATASVSKIFIEEGLDPLHPRYYDVSTAQTGEDNPEGYWFVEFPLFGLIHSWGYKVLGEQIGLGFEVVGRVVSIFAALISTVFIFRLGKRFMGLTGGLVTAFFFTFLPFNIYYTRVILPEPLAVAFGLMGLWYFTKYIDFDNTKYLWLSGVLFAVSILVKPFTIFYAAPMLYLLWDKDRTVVGKLKDKKLWLYGFIVLTPFVLWRLWMNQFPEGIPHLKWAFNGDGIRFRPAFWRWIVGERLGRLILGVWGGVIFIMGAIAKHKGSGFVLSFLLGEFMFISVFATANVRHDYYQIVTIPAISLVLAMGAISIWKVGASKAFHGLLAKVTLFFVVFMMLGMSWYQVREFYKINRPEIVEAGERINEIASKDSLVVAPYNKDMAFLYHTGRYGWPFVDGSIESLIEKGAEYYVSVNFDPVTLEIMEGYKVVEKTGNYVIVSLE